VVIQSFGRSGQVYDHLLICKIRNLFDYYNNKIAKMSQKRNNADGFPARTKDRLDILALGGKPKKFVRFYGVHPKEAFIIAPPFCVTFFKKTRNGSSLWNPAP
jgi:hypothetical protein